MYIHIYIYIHTICCMHGIFTYIWVMFIVNVGKHSMHAAFGYMYKSNEVHWNLKDVGHIPLRYTIPLIGKLPPDLNSEMVPGNGTKTTKPNLEPLQACWFQLRHPGTMASHTLQLGPHKLHHLHPFTRPSCLLIPPSCLKSRSTEVFVGGQIMYPLVIEHSCGKSQFSMGKSTNFL